MGLPSRLARSRVLVTRTVLPALASPRGLYSGASALRGSLRAPTLRRDGDWARERGISLPEELARAVETRNDVPDWKARYEELLREYEAVLNERDGLRREVDQLRAKRETVGPNERRSLLRMIIGMAMGGYGYNPKAERSPVPKDISKDLDEREISLDLDTVRKWLQTAAEEELLLDVAKPKSV